MADEREIAEQTPETDIDAAAAWAREHWRGVLVAAVAVLLAISCCSMQFNPDSIHYVDVARTIAHDHIIGTWHLTAESQRVPDTLLYWPPLYPIALAIFIGMGLSAGVATWAVSVAGYTASAWLLSMWQKRPALGIAGVLAFIHLAFLSGVPFRAWSESVFVPLMLGSLVVMAAATASESTRRAGWLGLGAGALAGGAMLARYPGVAIAPALAAVAFLAPWHEDEQEGVRRNAILAAAGGMALVIIPWLVRNVALNGRLFGPARPPNMRPISEILFFTGASIYYDLGALLLALIFGVVGFHLVRRRESGADERHGGATLGERSVPALQNGDEGRLRDWVFSGGLASGAMVCALSQIALILLTYLLFQVDEPPTKRYFFPAYTCVLLAGLALFQRARLPERVLSERWGLLVALAAPIVIGPMFAGSVATNVTPRETQLDQWIDMNTAANDLIIADRGWPIRFYTGRPVLEAGQVAATPISEGEKVAAVLERAAEKVGDVYVIPRGEEETRKVLASYPAAGLRVEEVATVETLSHNRQAREAYEQTVYRVEWAAGRECGGSVSSAGKATARCLTTLTGWKACPTKRQIRGIGKAQPGGQGGCREDIRITMTVIPPPCVGQASLPAAVRREVAERPRAFQPVALSSAGKARCLTALAGWKPAPRVLWAVVGLPACRRFSASVDVPRNDR